MHSLEEIYILTEEIKALAEKIDSQTNRPWGVHTSAADFEYVLNNKGLHDKTTGLVWQVLNYPPAMDWKSAYNWCMETNHGDVGGWRMPTSP